MDLFDPHIHMVARTTDDYEAMALAGIRRIIEPAFWLGEPRTSAETLIDYFRWLTNFERRRAQEFGIESYQAIAVNPREANDRALADEALARIGPFLELPSVVAVGEVGFDSITESEEAVMRRQVELALDYGLVLLVHSPHVNKKGGTERSIAILREMQVPMGRVVLDHMTEETTGLALKAGCWAGHSIYPSKLTPERMARLVRRYGPERLLINSAADWGRSDPLSVPKTVFQLRAAGFDDSEIVTIVWENPTSCFGQSGRLPPFGNRPVQLAVASPSPQTSSI